MAHMVVVISEVILGTWAQCLQIFDIVCGPGLDAFKSLIMWGPGLDAFKSLIMWGPGLDAFISMVSTRSRNATSNHHHCDRAVEMNLI